jgi:hypothetical protein
MRVNLKSVLIVIAIAAIVSCLALANIQHISTPRLVIKFDGKPASDVKLILPVSSDRRYQLDGGGGISVRALGSGGPILIPKPDGGEVFRLGFRRMERRWSISKAALLSSRSCNILA